MRARLRQLTSLVATAIAVLGISPTVAPAWTGPLETIASGVYDVPSAAVATAVNGDVYVAYASRASASATTYTVRLVRRPVAGTRSAADPGFVTKTLGTSSSPDSRYPRLAALPGGGMLALWYDATGLRLQAFTAAGEPTTSQLVTSTPPLDAQLAVDGAGRAYVSWMDDGTPSEISQHLSIRSTSGTMSGPMTLGTDQLPLSPVRIAVSPGGVGIAAWSTVLAPQSLQLRARMFGPSGPTGSVTDIVHGTDINDLLNPTVAVDAPGERAIVAWTQSVAPDAGGAPRKAVFASLVGPAGWYIHPQQLSSQSFGATGEPRAASGSTGELLVGFDQLKYNNISEVQVARFPASSNTPLSPAGVAAAFDSRLVLLGLPGAPGVRALTTAIDANGQLVPAVSWDDPFSYYATAVATPGTDRTTTFVDAAADQDGDGYVVLLRSNGTNVDVKLGSTDARPPAIDSATVPKDAVAGTSLTVSAVARDTVGPTTVTWTFGDGSPGLSGPSAQHVYAQAGLYPVTLTATDGSGQRVSKIQYVTVARAPTPPATTNADTGATPGTGGATPGPSVPPTTTTTTLGPEIQAKSTPTPVPRFKVSMVAQGHRVIGLLAVGVLRGGRVTLLCQKGCGHVGARLGSARATAKVRRPRIDARLRVGAVLEVRVSASGRSTRFARFRILSRSPFSARVADGCLDARGRAAGC
jgi:hypothetical protein